MSDTTDTSADEAPTADGLADASPEDLRKEIAKLRNEAGKYRTRAKDLERDVERFAAFASVPDDALRVFAKGAEIYGAGDDDGAADWFRMQYEALRPDDDDPAPREDNDMADEPTDEQLRAGAAQGFTADELRAAMRELREEERELAQRQQIAQVRKKLGYDQDNDPVWSAVATRAAELAREAGTIDIESQFTEADRLVREDFAKRFGGGGSSDNQTDASDDPPGEGAHVPPPGGVAPGKTGGGDERPDPRTRKGRQARKKAAVEALRAMKAGGDGL